MNKKIIKRVVIITVAINIVIALFVGGKVTIEKTREEFAKRSSEFSQNMPKIPGNDSGFSLTGSGQPACTDDKDFHARLVYARAKDTASRFKEMAPKLRDYFKSADGIVNDEAKKFNISAHLKVFCEGGEISITEVALPNTEKYYSSISDTRGVLTSDLKKLGFNKESEKYIVFYDGSASGCRINGVEQPCVSQQTEKGPDDRLIKDNIYNQGPDFALLYKVDENMVQQFFGTSYEMLAPILVLHEYAHTLGAVQHSAPNATKKEPQSLQKHCMDSPTIGKGGTDIMCKSDGEGEVFGNACPGTYPFVFDCNNDDYFNPKPEAGSYLATHWNLGSKLNRFIQFDK